MYCVMQLSFHSAGRRIKTFRNLHQNFINILRAVAEKQTQLRTLFLFHVNAEPVDLAAEAFHTGRQELGTLVA